MIQFILGSWCWYEQNSVYRVYFITRSEKLLFNEEEEEEEEDEEAEEAITLV